MTWEEYEDLIRHLIDQVKHVKYDQILCIGRGGFMVGDALSRALKCDLAVIMAKSYSGNRRGVLFLSDIAFLSSFKGTILIVDDIVDSGVTMAEVIKTISKQPGIDHIFTASLIKKRGAAFNPDFFAKEVKGNDWIEQPFEKWERKRL